VLPFLLYVLDKVLGMKKSWVTLLVSMAISMAAFAQELPFTVVYGDFVQGSVVGIASLHAKKAWVNDKALIINDDGESLFGIDRDASSLTFRWQDSTGKVHEIVHAVVARSYDIQHINGLPNNKVNPNPQEVAKIIENNKEIAQVRLKRENTVHPALPLDWPVSGRISGVYGSQRILNGQPRRPHFGVDIAAPIGTPVYAPADAQVVLVNPDMVLTGKTMMLDHGMGLKSIYVHLSEIDVHNGEHVVRGQLIGHVGKTGRATGPHLHWGMSWFDVQVDAAKLVATAQPPAL
jgi:murein DD-endopeptidase MepM/ murein hydrolase activator NlpD